MLSDVLGESGQQTMGMIQGVATAGITMATAIDSVEKGSVVLAVIGAALTAVTAIFLPLNLFTGFFGMNFEHLPLIHSTEGMWVALALLALLAGGILAIFWRRRYLTRTGR